MGRVKAILFGGLAAGIGDIVYAFVVFGLAFGAAPMRILQSIAAGWIGREASRAGEWGTALLGLATHFLLATIMAAVFVIAASGNSALTKRPMLWGFLYGVVLMVAMNYVVVPLSAAATGHFAFSLHETMTRVQTAFSELPGDVSGNPLMFAGTIFTHTVLVGIPIALINARFNRQQA